MNNWKQLKREIGNPLTTIYCHKGKMEEYTQVLKSVSDCFSIDYGSDYMDFNFVDTHYAIYQLIDQNGNIIYENPRALHYYYTFNSFDDVVNERFRLFGEDYLRASIKLKDNFIDSSIKYSKKFRDEFNEAIKNSKNNLSYWYPKLNNIGFRTPKTETYNLTDNITQPLLKFIESKNTDLESFEEYKKNLLKLILTNTQFCETDKLFIKSGVFSNKFDFDSCTINNIEELPLKFSKIFTRELRQARGTPPTEIVLREFIMSSTIRKTIYNGMPLNTEFRVFYDFDNKKLLGIENYWNPDEMESGLKNNSDINNYLDEQDNINSEFKKLKSQLIFATNKLQNANLKGNWSVDFMWNGSEFILIDMALAECSSFWEKHQHLSANGIDKNSITIPEGVLPKKVIQFIEQSKHLSNSLDK